MSYASHQFPRPTAARAAKLPPGALLELGLRYCIGRDVSQDLVEAHKWFNLAAMNGSKEALRYRSEVSGEMTRTEICKAQRLAREWLAVH